ncbi:MAG: GIY-YIG nuclease family protein [Parcubacteria group bacterium]
MYTVYIQQSEINKKYYTGHTENLANRLKQHNSGEVRSTKTGRPWHVVYTENFGTKNEAYKREMQIKSYKGGEAFKKLVNGIK